MPLILSVDLTEIALFRDADETSGHRDLIHIGAADESSAVREVFEMAPSGSVLGSRLRATIPRSDGWENARLHGRLSGSIGRAFGSFPIEQNAAHEELAYVQHLISASLVTQYCVQDR